MYADYKLAFFTGFHASLAGGFKYLLNVHHPKFSGEDEHVLRNIVFRWLKLPLDIPDM